MKRFIALVLAALMLLSLVSCGGEDEKETTEAIGDQPTESEGTTDDIGGEEYNLRLSERRAESVKYALINKGVSSERIKTKGCGYSQPLPTNNFDDELKTLSRRVSMSLLD